MTHYQYLSTIYTPDFLFYAGCAQQPNILIDLESSTIMESFSYDQNDVVSIIQNYWSTRTTYESQFGTTDLVMPDYIQDTISHSEKQINAINNELLSPENRVYG